jgi:chromosomal replication initiator protein
MEGPERMDFRLSKYVPLPENRVVVAAAQRILDCLALGKPLTGVTPMFVYGPVGCGKSHLLHGLVQAIRERFDKASITFMHPAEPAVQRPDAARHTAEPEILLVEDLHRFGVQTIQEEELVRQLDEARLPGRLVLVGSRRPPKRLQLGSRIISRLQQGLVLSLCQPGVASRARLVLEFAARRQLPLQPALLEPLVDRLPSSIRQLEAFVAGIQQTRDGLFRMGSILDSLREGGEHSASPQRRLHLLVERVAELFVVPPRSLRSSRRDRRSLLPRQVAMFLAREQTRLPLKRIGQFFGNRDHATVLHACRKVEHDARGNPAFAELLGELRMEAT